MKTSMFLNKCLCKKCHHLRLWCDQTPYAIILQCLGKVVLLTISLIIKLVFDDEWIIQSRRTFSPSLIEWAFYPIHWFRIRTLNSPRDFLSRIYIILCERYTTTDLWSIFNVGIIMGLNKGQSFVAIEKSIVIFNLYRVYKSKTIKDEQNSLAPLLWTALHHTEFSYRASHPRLKRFSLVDSFEEYEISYSCPSFWDWKALHGSKWTHGILASSLSFCAFCFFNGFLSLRSFSPFLVPICFCLSRPLSFISAELQTPYI